MAAIGGDFVEQSWRSRCLEGKGGFMCDATSFSHLDRWKGGGRVEGYLGPQSASIAEGGHCIMSFDLAFLRTHHAQGCGML